MALKLKSAAKAENKPVLNLSKKKATEPVAEETPDKPKPSFLMKGKAAKQALADEQVAAAVRQEARDNEVFRFYIKPEGERTITFLDGGLDDVGDLDGICYYEHTINNPAQKYPKYVCINFAPSGTECPICNSGNNPYFATVFTVLVHDTWHSKKEKKDYEGSVQLFVAKQGVADKLRKKAKKIGGLTGATFEVSRTNEDAWNVGDDFEYLQTNSLEELAEAFPDCDVQPLDYDTVIKYHTEDELIALGFGQKTQAVGSETSVSEDEVL